MLRDIQRWVYEDIGHLDEDDFEKLHYNDVTTYIKSLAKQRGLNHEIALMIGMMHDIGRTKLSKSGRAHNISGEMLTSYYLENKGVDHEIIEIVSNAVLNHSTKSTIDDPYSELIKDADSMAHMTEFGALDLNHNEQVRCEIAFLDKPLIKSKKYRKLGKIIDNLLMDLVKGLKSKPLLGGDVDKVIKLSKDIYGIRSIIWLVKQSDKVAYEQLKVLDATLKQAARVFDSIRTYKSYMDLIEPCRHNKRSIGLLNQGVTYHQEMIYKQVKYFVDCKSLESSVGQFRHLLVRPLMSEKLINNYKEVHISLPSDSWSDHKKAYLYGKQLCILNEYKIIKLAKPFKRNLYELNRLLSVSDEGEGLKKLLTKNKRFTRYVSNKEKKDITTYIDKCSGQNHKKIQQGLFVTDLLLRDTHVSLSERHINENIK